jgi:hypothetical protein
VLKVMSYFIACIVVPHQLIHLLQTVIRSKNLAIEEIQHFDEAEDCPETEIKEDTKFYRWNLKCMNLPKARVVCVLYSMAITVISSSCSNHCYVNVHGMGFR